MTPFTYSFCVHFGFYYTVNYLESIRKYSLVIPLTVQHLSTHSCNAYQLSDLYTDGPEWSRLGTIFSHLASYNSVTRCDTLPPKTMSCPHDS